jgi:hypothetical protein
MALTAWAIDEHESDAQVIRQAMGALINPAGGVLATGGLEPTQKATPNMSVIIRGGTPAEGGAIIPGYADATGPYYFQNTATYECPIATAGATYNRVDTIVARVYDTALDSSGKHEPAIEALKGAEEAGVTLENLKGIAAVPKASLVICYVLVAKGATSIVTADIRPAAPIIQVAEGLVTTPSLAALSVTTGRIANHAVDDEKIAEGRQLIKTEPVYGGVNSYPENTAQVPSATRMTFVMLTWVVASGEVSGFELFVGTQDIAFGVGNPGTTTQRGAFGFLCPAGASWKWKTTGGKLSIEASYLIL